MTGPADPAVCKRIQSLREANPPGAQAACVALIPSDSIAAGSGSDASRRWLSWRDGAGVPSPCDAGAQLTGGCRGTGTPQVIGPSPSSSGAGGWRQRRANARGLGMNVQTSWQALCSKPCREPPSGGQGGSFPTHPVQAPFVQTQPSQTAAQALRAGRKATWVLSMGRTSPSKRFAAS